MQLYYGYIILDFDEKIGTDEISEGVLTTSVLGAHTANPISGDFSVEASNAFKIENGEISYPINKAMISGNIFEIISVSYACIKLNRKNNIKTS